jgi:hypothetical protein
VQATDSHEIEVRLPDGRGEFFYWDDVASRRLRPGDMRRLVVVVGDHLSSHYEKSSISLSARGEDGR